MGFLASELKRAMAAQLGTFGTQRYLDVPHYIPAIQSGMRRFKALVGSVFAENKGGEELFSEITETRIFQTSEYGDIRFRSSQLGHPIWSIVAIYPEPTTRPTNNIIPAPAGESLLRSDLFLLRPGKFPCERMTAEEAAIAQGNRFASGNEVLAPGPRRSYGYYIRGDKSPGWVSGDMEIVVTPESITGTKLMGATYLRDTEPIQSMSDTIPYPYLAFELLKSLSLNEMSIRQGAKPLFDVSLNEVRTLLVSQA